MLKIIKLFLAFLFLIIISLFSFLYSGIKIDSFSFSNILISQFYIKIDKKLILNIENVEYKSKKSKSKSSFDDLKNNISLLPKVLKLFESINIERIKIDDNEFKIILDNEILYLDNKFINISSKIDTSSNQVVFDLYSLYLKDLELLFDGKIKVDYFNEKLNYYGKFYYQDIESNLNIEMTKKLARFYLVSNHFKSLKFLKKFITLPSIAEEWMYDNVEGDLKLQDFYGEFDLEKNQIIEDSLQGNAQIEAAKIRFNKNLDIVNTKSLDISFKNDKLHLNLIEPIYKDKKLDGSYVTIHNLTSAKNGEVELNIKTNSKLDKDVLDILKAYKINLPLVQKTGNTDAYLSLIFPYEAEKHMTTKGIFLVSDADIFINNFAFSSKNAEVILDGTNVEIKNADFKHKNMIDANINLIIDTKTLKSKGTADIKSFLINKEDGEDIVHIQNKKTPISLNFNKEVTIELKDLDTNIKISDLVYVDIKNLSKIYPYSKLLRDTSIKEGNISLAIKDDKNITFNAYIKGLEYPIQKDEKAVENLDITGVIQDKNILISSIDGNIKLEIKNDLNIFLKNLDVVINSEDQNNKFSKNMNINLENSQLKIDDSIYQIKNAKINIIKDQINFDGTVTNLDIPLKKDNKSVQELTLSGIYKSDLTTLSSNNKDLILELKKDSLSLKVHGYDVLYSSLNEKTDKESYKYFKVEGKNSNIIINNKYKFLADNYEINITDDNKYIHLKHKKTDITIKESKEKKLDIFANDLSDEFINAIFDKKIFKGGNMLLLANGNIDDLNGKFILDDSNIEDLAILNNLLIFIHTSPGLINPLLAIPSVIGMATTSGFNLTAYKVVNGSIEFNYNKSKELLDIKKLLAIGNGIDFDGKGKVDLNNLTLQSDIKLVFLKDYSSIVGMIPVVNYVLLGDNNRVETHVNIFGDLSNPKISTNLTKDAFSVPLNIVKRIWTSPSVLLDFISGKETKEEKETNENMINKPLQ
jgi:hypothetical protein